MAFHVHVGLLQGFVLFLYVLLFGTAWRLIAMHLHGNAVGQAMAVAY